MSWHPGTLKESKKNSSVSGCWLLSRNSGLLGGFSEPWTRGCGTSGCLICPQPTPLPCLTWTQVTFRFCSSLACLGLPVWLLASVHRVGLLFQLLPHQPCSCCPGLRAAALAAPMLPGAVAPGLEETGSQRLMSPPAGRPDPCCMQRSVSIPATTLLLLLLLLQYFITQIQRPWVRSMLRQVTQLAPPTRICSCWMAQLSFP